MAGVLDLDPGFGCFSSRRVERTYIYLPGLPKKARMSQTPFCWIGATRRFADADLTSQADPHGEARGARGRAQRKPPQRRRIRLRQGRSSEGFQQRRGLVVDCSCRGRARERKGGKERAAPMPVCAHCAYSYGPAYTSTKIVASTVPSNFRLVSGSFLLMV